MAATPPYIQCCSAKKKGKREADTEITIYRTGKSGGFLKGAISAVG